MARWLGAQSHLLLLLLLLFFFSCIVENRALNSHPHLSTQLSSYMVYEVSACLHEIDSNAVPFSGSFFGKCRSYSRRKTSVFLPFSHGIASTCIAIAVCLTSCKVVQEAS